MYTYMTYDINDDVNNYTIEQNGYTIDTDKRKKALADKMKANAQAAEAAKAKAKALAEKNKLLQVKAVEQKKKLALEAKMKAEKAKALALKVNKTVGGSSKFKNSFTPAPAKADPFKGKEYKGGFSLFGLFGKKEKK